MTQFPMRGGCKSRVSVVLQEREGIDSGNTTFTRPEGVPAAGP